MWPFRPRRRIVVPRQEIGDFVVALYANARHPWVTCLIAALCAGNFLWMCFSGGSFLETFLEPGGDAVFRAGGNLPWATLAGEPWRLLSSAFVHVGALHLFFNLYVLLVTGPTVERLFGHALYALVYAGAAISGSLLTSAMRMDVVSAGASGALFGLFGALLAYALRCRGGIPDPIRGKMVQNAIVCVILNFAYGATRPNIDNWCHLGGLIGGFLCGCVAALPLRPQDRESSVFSRFVQLAILLPVLAVPAFLHLRATRPWRYPAALLQCRHIQERFEAEHPEVFQPAEDPSAEELFHWLGLQIDALYDPQIALLEAVPPAGMTKEDARQLSRRIAWIKAIREAFALHRRMLEENNPALRPEVEALYFKAHRMSP